MDLGLFLLRLVVGTTIAAHGAQKVFGWFGGHGPTGTAGWLESLGWRPGRFYSALNGWAEIGAGSMLALGLVTPLAAAGVIGVMVVAIAAVHWKNGFFATAGGYEFNLVLIAAAAALAFTGPGSISLDRAAGLAFGGLDWGMAALVVGTAAGAVTLAARRPAAAPAQAQEAPAERRAA